MINVSRLKIIITTISARLIWMFTIANTFGNVPEDLNRVYESINKEIDFIECELDIAGSPTWEKIVSICENTAAIKDKTAANVVLNNILKHSEQYKCFLGSNQERFISFLAETCLLQDILYEELDRIYLENESARKTNHRRALNKSKLMMDDKIRDMEFITSGLSTKYKYYLDNGNSLPVQLIDDLPTDCEKSQRRNTEFTRGEIFKQIFPKTTLCSSLLSCAEDIQQHLEHFKNNCPYEFGNTRDAEIINLSKNFGLKDSKEELKQKVRHVLIGSLMKEIFRRKGDMHISSYEELQFVEKTINKFCAVINKLEKNEKFDLKISEHLSIQHYSNCSCSNVPKEFDIFDFKFRYRSYKELSKDHAQEPTKLNANYANLRAKIINDQQARDLEKIEIINLLSLIDNVARSEQFNEVDSSFNSDQQILRFVPLVLKKPLIKESIVSLSREELDKFLERLLKITQRLTTDDNRSEMSTMEGFFHDVVSDAKSSKDAQMQDMFKSYHSTFDPGIPNKTKTRVLELVAMEQECVSVEHLSSYVSSIVKGCSIYQKSVSYFKRILDYFLGNYTYKRKDRLRMLKSDFLLSLYKENEAPKNLIRSRVHDLVMPDDKTVMTGILEEMIKHTLTVEQKLVEVSDEFDEEEVFLGFSVLSVLNPEIMKAAKAMKASYGDWFTFLKQDMSLQNDSLVLDGPKLVKSFLKRKSKESRMYEVIFKDEICETDVCIEMQIEAIGRFFDTFASTCFSAPAREGLIDIFFFLNKHYQLTKVLQEDDVDENNVLEKLYNCKFCIADIVGYELAQFFYKHVDDISHIFPDDEGYDYKYVDRREEELYDRGIILDESNVDSPMSQEKKIHHFIDDPRISTLRHFGAMDELIDLTCANWREEYALQDENQECDEFDYDTFYDLRDIRINNKIYRLYASQEPISFSNKMTEVEILMHAVGLMVSHIIKMRAENLVNPEEKNNYLRCIFNQAIRYGGTRLMIEDYAGDLFADFIAEVSPQGDGPHIVSNL